MKNSTNHKERTIQNEFKQIQFVYLHQEAQRVGNFCTDVWNQSEIETWYGQVFLITPWVHWIWGSIALGKSLLWVRIIFLNMQSGGVFMNCLNRFEILVKMWWKLIVFNRVHKLTNRHFEWIVDCLSEKA